MSGAWEALLSRRRSVGDSHRPTRKLSRNGRGAAHWNRAPPSSRRAESRVRLAQLLRCVAPRTRTQRPTRQGGAARNDRRGLESLCQTLPQRVEAAGGFSPPRPPYSLVAPYGSVHRLLREREERCHRSVLRGVLEQ